MMTSRRLRSSTTVGIAICSFFLLTNTLSSVVVDLSYQPHLNADALAATIGETVWRDNEKDLDIVEVDVSSSLLGDSGMEKILKTLLPDKKGSEDGSIKTVNLAARMNGLTPSGVASMLQMISRKQPADKVGSENSNVTETDKRSWYLHSLDVGWNYLNPEKAGSKPFQSALRSLVSDPECCPRILRFDRCGLTPASCRAIGKGIVNRFADAKSKLQHRPLSLHLCGNDAIGDAGVAALAAALRTSTPASRDESSSSVFDVLDLSACDVGDAGAEALAMALESHPCCIRHLDLSNNRISDEGAAAIAKALLNANNGSQNSISLPSLDLSNNMDVGDRGAAAIAGAMEHGKLVELSLRSCHIHADGAEAFGRTLRGLPLLDGASKQLPRKMDLSGNPFGVLRMKTKGGGKYSATRLKSKASATASSYMSFIGKNIRSGLKDVGLNVGSSGLSGESDDEEEELMGLNESSNNGDKELDPSKARCGAKSFASVVLDADGNEEEKDSSEKASFPENGTLRCELAMRHCFLDQGAADALAAVVVRAKEQLGIDLRVDARMNTVLETDMVEALKGDTGAQYHLEEMAERHMEAMETLRIAKERAEEAAEAANSRIAAMDAAWGDYDDDYDSDAVYDVDEYDY